MPPKPTILSFDTSAARCAAVLHVGAQVLVRVDDMAKGQAEHLIGMLEEMLAEATLSWDDLDAIGVGIGPGNFTGIRISVSAARGLAMGLNVPAIGVSGFDVIRAGAEADWAVIAGPRGTFYAQSGQDAPVILDDIATLEGTVMHLSDLTVAQQIENLGAVARGRVGDDLPPPAPLYVRAADAAPASDPPPVILP